MHEFAATGGPVPLAAGEVENHYLVVVLGALAPPHSLHGQGLAVGCQSGGHDILELLCGGIGLLFCGERFPGALLRSRGDVPPGHQAFAAGGDQSFAAVDKPQRLYLVRMAFQGVQILGGGGVHEDDGLVLSDCQHSAVRRKCQGVRVTRHHGSAPGQLLAGGGVPENYIPAAAAGRSDPLAIRRKDRTVDIPARNVLETRGAKPRDGRGRERIVKRLGTCGGGGCEDGQQRETIKHGGGSQLGAGWHAI
jgi:hypothetical protein